MKKITKSLVLAVCFGVAFAFNGANAVAKKGYTFGMIKPSGIDHVKEIKAIINAHGLIIMQQRKLVLKENRLDKLYEMHKEKPFYGDLKSSLLNKEVIAMKIYGENAVENYRDAVKEIREKYAVNKTENAVHGSDSPERAKIEINLFFPAKKMTPKRIETKMSENNVNSVENK